jgi:hypothetical protein
MIGLSLLPADQEEEAEAYFFDGRIEILQLIKEFEFEKYFDVSFSDDSVRVHFRGTKNSVDNHFFTLTRRFNETYENNIFLPHTVFYANNWKTIERQTYGSTIPYHKFCTAVREEMEILKRELKEEKVTKSVTFMFALKIISGVRFTYEDMRPYLNYDLTPEETLNFMILGVPEDLVEASKGVPLNWISDVIGGAN